MGVWLSRVEDSRSSLGGMRKPYKGLGRGKGRRAMGQGPVDSGDSKDFDSPHKRLQYRTKDLLHIPHHTAYRTPRSRNRRRCHCRRKSRVQNHSPSKQSQRTTLQYHPNRSSLCRMFMRIRIFVFDEVIESRYAFEIDFV